MKTSIQKLCMCALFAALCYIGFTYFKINIPIAGGTTAIHFGNTFCVLAALLLGGKYGGLAGAIGMGIADLMDPLYISSFPKTILLKFCIGYIVGYIAHEKADIRNPKHSFKYVFYWLIIASSCGMLFNVIFEPIVSFLYKSYILQVPVEAAKIFAAWTGVSTLINACTSVIISTILYQAIYPRIQSILKKFF